MGKKRAAAVSAAPAVPFPAAAGAAAAEPEPDHFSDYGFDPQLLHFFSQPEVKRLWGRRQLKPLESARFKLQKPISKTKHHQHRPQKQQQQRRRWWSSAAAAALHLFRLKKRPSSASTRPATAAAAPTTPPYGSSAASATVPLYLADYDSAGGGASSCTCWAPAVRSGGSRLAAAELGAAAVAVPYVSLRSTGLAGGGTRGAPVMPIYLVT